MKNAIILHGTGGSPKSFWFPDIKNFLESKGYDVWAPQLPDSENPKLEKNLNFIFDNGKFNEQTIMIGHSSGCPLILSVLERLSVKIREIFLVAGFYRSLDGKPNLVLQDSYNWKKIKNNVEKIIVINSDNDPWGCDDKIGKEMADRLGGKFILRSGEGHMGSDSFNQPYEKFSFLKKLLSV